MLIGLVVMRWDDINGTQLIAKYPEKTEISEKVLMQVYSTHEYSGESGMIKLMVGSLNLVSYYIGPELPFYIILLLNIDDDPDAYEDGLVDLAYDLFIYQKIDTYQKVIPSLFQHISIYPLLDEYQTLASLYRAELRREILDKLYNDPIISKYSVINNFKAFFPGIESFLTSFFKNDIVKIISPDFILLKQIIKIFRWPPTYYVKNPSGHELHPSLQLSYIKEVQNFFEKYAPSEKDNLNIIDKIILNPNNYKMLKLLRKFSLRKDDLENLKVKGFKDVNSSINILLENKVITTLRDENGVEYFAMITDIIIDKIIPFDIINKIRVYYNDKTRPRDVLIQHLNILKELILSNELDDSRNKRIYIKKVIKYALKIIEKFLKQIEDGATWLPLVKLPSNREILHRKYGSIMELLNLSGPFRLNLDEWKPSSDLEILFGENY